MKLVDMKMNFRGQRLYIESLEDVDVDRRMVHGFTKWAYELDDAEALFRPLPIIPKSVTYVEVTPVLSVADLYEDGTAIVNFRDFAVFAEEWLQTQLWP